MLNLARRPGAVTALFLAAIVAGSLIGVAAPAAGAALGGVVDPAILVLVGTLAFTVRIDGFTSLRRAPRTVLLALIGNFVAVPLIAFMLTSVLVPDEALRLGVLIYCLFPCTDWFLGFTRMAGGDTTIGAALIPVQLVLQLLLYPVWLALFTSHAVASVAGTIGPALLTWFALPVGIAVAARVLLRLVAPARVRARALGAVDGVVPFVIAAVIVGIFAANVQTILADPGAFVGVLVVVFVFFVITYGVGEGAARVLRLPYPEHALLTMTTSARNAPLMLAVTSVAIPEQPVVYAAIVLGMLVEFPHLTVLTHLLRRRSPESVPPGEVTLAA